MRFTRCSCASIKAVKAFCEVGFSTGGALFCCSFWVGGGGSTGVAEGGFWGGESRVGKTDFKKLSKPKASIRKKPPKFQNFSGKIIKTTLFSIALIDNLIYNRICVNIVEQYTLLQYCRRIDEN